MKYERVEKEGKERKGKGSKSEKRENKFSFPVTLTYSVFLHSIYFYIVSFITKEV